MPVFVYKARDKTGLSVVGELVAVDANFVKDTIASQGLFPVSVELKVGQLSMKSLPLMQKKLKPKDLANLTRQFEVMFGVGTPMDRILSTMARQAEHKGLKEALEQIQRDVAGGMRLSQAFSRYPEYFSSLYTSMLEMGQAGGVLDKTLREMAAILLKEHNIKAKVKSALLYPKIVLGALVVVSWAMLAFVFPPFAALYKGYGAELPLPTKILMAFSTLATTYWYIAVLGIGVGIFGWKRFAKTEKGKWWLSKLAFKVPVFGKLNLLVANARFGHLIAALYRAGLPLPQSLAVVAATMTNARFADEVRQLKLGLEHGRSLSQCMAETHYFAPMVRETVAVGEQTGKLDIILDATATFYDGEVDDMLTNLATLIEPFVLVLLFGAVMILALAVYLPIWNMSKVILSPS